MAAQKLLWRRPSLATRPCTALRVLVVVCAIDCHFLRLSNSRFWNEGATLSRSTKTRHMMAMAGRSEFGTRAHRWHWSLPPFLAALRALQLGVV